jgi:hypothetical protein
VLEYLHTRLRGRLRDVRRGWGITGVVENDGDVGVMVVGFVNIGYHCFLRYTRAQHYSAILHHGTTLCRNGSAEDDMLTPAAATPATIFRHIAA